MDLKWLEDFVVLTRAGSFSKAAAKRYVTQPAFSRRIRSLEDWTGAILIDRSANPVELTQAGRDFLPHAMSIISEAESVKQEFRLVYGADNSAIRIITSHRLSVHMVPRLVAGFLRENPDITVSVLPKMESAENYGNYADALIMGVADFLITYEHESLMFDENLTGSLERIDIENDRIVPIASPEYARKIPAAWHCDESFEIEFVGYPDYSFTERIIHPVIHRFAKRLRKTYESPITGSIRAMLLEGIGMTWLPFSVVADDVAAGRLVCLDGDDLSVDIKVIMYRRTESRGPVMDRFWHHVAGGPQLD